MTCEAQRELMQWVPRLANARVLVIGDLFLDEYIVGRATRLSREAPIPVLEFVRRSYIPGGAANPAHNICALGGQATLVGLVGRDPAASQLLSELHKAGMDAAGVVVDESRPTTTKTRILAESSLHFPQQLARIDHLDRRTVGGAIEAELLKRIERLLPGVDAVLVSDYQTGVAGPAVVRAALEATHARHKLCTVDAQGSFEKYVGFDLIKANRHEIETALDCRLSSEDGYRRAGERLLYDLKAGAVIITRGAEGLSLVSDTGHHIHLPAANRTEVFDVTGAGDTVIAVATLALLAGANATQAARLANYAAGLVVRKLGNAVVTAEELTQAIADA